VGVLVKKSIWLPRYTFAGWIGYLIAGFIGACILIASLARACGGLQQRKPVPSLPVMFSTAKLIFDLHLAWRRQLLKNHILFQIDDHSKFETQKGLIFSFVLDAGFGMGFPSSAIVKFMRQLVTFRMGAQCLQSCSDKPLTLASSAAWPSPPRSNLAD
jgi:hypothetical protein